MPRFANPYQAQTPYGRGAANIASALLYSNRGGQTTNPARDEMNMAHADLYRSQERKNSVEADIARSLLESRSYDSITDAAAAAAEMPGYTFRSIHDANRGMGDLSQYSPEEIARYRRAWASYAPGYADKTVDPAAIAQALLRHGELGDRNRVIAGTQDPTRTTQGYFATSGKAPFDNSSDGTFNVLTGAESLNDVGRARIGELGGRARASNALGAQREHETRTGVRIGAPVLVNDIEAGPIYTAPSAAIGRPPAAKPGSGGLRLKPVVNENGETVWMPESDASGMAVGAPPRATRPTAPRRISGVDRQLFDSALSGLVEEIGASAPDEATRNAILRRAEQEWQAGSAGHANAVKAAMDAIAPDGLEAPWYRWSSRPTGGIRQPPPIAAPGVGAPPATGQRVANPWRAYVAPSGRSYTEADINMTAQKRGLTPQQVIQQLQLREGG